MEQKDQPIRSNVLSADEESALSLVREIVVSIRAHGAAVDSGSVEQALTAAGASRTGDAAEPEFRVFSLRSARFSVLTNLHPSRGVEVNFDP
jgi:hypothetical protein